MRLSREWSRDFQRSAMTVGFPTEANADSGLIYAADVLRWRAVGAGWPSR
jgi:hypothetical protein